MYSDAETGAVALAAGWEPDACWVSSRAIGTAGEVAGDAAARDCNRSGSESREGEDGKDAGELHFDGGAVGLKLKCSMFEDDVNGDMDGVIDYLMRKSADYLYAFGSDGSGRK